MDIVKRAWSFITKPTAKENIKDIINWAGIVKTSKTVQVQLIDNLGKKETRIFKKDKHNFCNFTYLWQLVLRQGQAIKNGLIDYSIFKKSPLKIAIVKDTNELIAEPTKNEEGLPSID